VDAVLIASSSDSHSEHVRRAADAGIAAFCEKPIDLDLRRATDTVAYAAARGTHVMVDFNRRFDHDYAELKRLVDRGEIGDLELVQLSSRGPTMPPLIYIAVSGGQMRDQAVHFFDLARWIAGLDPIEVFATGSTLAEPAWPTRATSTPAWSPSDCPPAPSSRSTAHVAPATDTTNASRSSAPPA